MGALGWLLNLDFAGGSGVVDEGGTRRQRQLPSLIRSRNRRTRRCADDDVLELPVHAIIQQPPHCPVVYAGDD